MKKLNRDQRKEWDELTVEFASAYEELEPLVDRWNDAPESSTPAALDALESKLQKSWSHWASVALDVKAFAEKIRDDAQDYFEEKSERWQEGGAGEEYSSFIDAWSEVADLDVPDMSDSIDEDSGELQAPESPDDGPVSAAPMEPGE